MAKKAFKTWVTGEVVTAAQMNEQIRDNGNELWKGTTAGDLDFYTSATTKDRIGIGTAGQVLTSGSASNPLWTGYTGCKLWLSTYQAVNDSSETEVSAFNTETFDTDGFHSGTDKGITIPTGLAGVYTVGASGYWDSGGTDNSLKQITFRLNGSNTFGQSITSKTGDACWMDICNVLKLNAGDVLSVALLQKSGGAVNFRVPMLWAIKIK